MQLIHKATMQVAAPLSSIAAWIMSPDKVLLYAGRYVRHYGMNNPKEYFAEATEAYFGVNDFYPFVRAELKEHDPKMFALLVDIWGRVE